MGEERKHSTVDLAVADLMARDTQYREELRRQVSQKLNNAEKRRNLGETRRYQTIVESNRYSFCLW
jgi:hypothetical protein